MTRPAICQTSLPGREPDKRGKVRDIYDLGDNLLIVATDRISAFDWVNPVGIPDKGRMLTQHTGLPPRATGAAPKPTRKPR